MSKKLIVEVHHDARIRRLADAQNVPEGMMMVEGVFGRVDSLNRNNRIYSREEYSKHVARLNERIVRENGVLGEMEHPKSMNINLNNVSHKIVSVSVDEDGFVRGRALLMDTPKGMIAQSIVRSGLALPISSRAMGRVTEDNRVELDSLETFDLVGTAGFAESGLNRLFESKDEDGNILTEAYEYDLDENGDVIGNDEMSKTKIVEYIESRMAKDFEQKVRDIVSESKPNKAIDADDLEAEKDEDDVETVSETMVEKIIHEQITNIYAPIFEKWVVNDFGKDFGKVIESWVLTDFANKFGDVVEDWVTGEFANKFGGILENWVTGDFANKFGDVIEDWVKIDFVPEHSNILQEWMVKDFAPKYVEILNEDAKSKEVETVEKNPKDSEETEDEKATTEPKKIEESYKSQAQIFSTSIMEGIDKDIDDAEKAGEEEEEKRVEKETAKVDEGFFQPNAPIWLRMIPENFKPVWTSMNEEQRESLYRKASVRTLLTEGDVNRFWQSMNMETILKKPSVSSRNRVDEGVSTNSRFSRIGALAKALNG